MLVSLSLSSSSWFLCPSLFDVVLLVIAAIGCRSCSGSGGGGGGGGGVVVNGGQWWSVVVVVVFLLVLLVFGRCPCRCS